MSELTPLKIMFEGYLARFNELRKEEKKAVYAIALLGLTMSEVGTIPVGMWFGKTAFRKSITGVLQGADELAFILRRVFKRRLPMFVLGSAIAAAAGAIFVHVKGFANPDSFDISLGLGIFAVALSGLPSVPATQDL